MVSKVFDLFWIACLLLLWTGSAVRTRHGNSTNSTKPQKVPLQLSFSGVLQGHQRPDVKITADESKLMIMTEMVSNTTSEKSKLSDRSLVDVGKNARHEQERFFDERVCFTFDLFPSQSMRSPLKFKHLQRLRARLARGPQSLLHRSSQPGQTEGNESDTEMGKEELNHLLFLGAMSDIFEAPLQFYDMATVSEGVKNFTGLSCTPWRVNQSRSMPLGPMVQALLDGEASDLSDMELWWLQAVEDDEDGEAAGQLKSLVGQRPTGIVTMASAFEFCVTEKGHLLSTESVYTLTYMRLPDEDGNETSNETRTMSSTEVEPGHVVTIFEKTRSTQMLAEPQRPDAVLLDATYGVTGGECTDLTEGSTGEQELDEELNGEERLQRINREAGGRWDAGAYDFWKGLKVREVLSSLGTEMGPLKLPLRGPSRPSLKSEDKPRTFDARKRWPMCNSIGLIRNQGRCGSCWAVAAATVITDRFCVAAQGKQRSLLQASSNTTLEDMQALSLAPELLVQCDDVNNGCSGGRLDDAWDFLKHHGIPKESCAPYMHCPVPTQRSCSYGWEKRPFVPYGRSSEEKKKDICRGRCTDGSTMQFFRVSEAYAVAKPRDIGGMQRELMLAGPVEAAFYVFSDFMNYRSGVYFRTPGAYGPLGGHAVRLLGWGVDEELGKKPMDYWLIANSYSPLWGMHGLFKMRRGTNECGIESTPAAGTPELEFLLRGE